MRALTQEKFWKNLIREIVTNKRNFNTLDIGL